MSRLHDEMDRLFGNVAQRPVSPTSYPALNLWEDDERYGVEAELPGMELADLEIYVQGHQLSIKGERKPPQVEEANWLRRERGYGVFTRVIELPGSVNGEGVNAEFKHGVLTITLPKREDAKPRRIAVRGE
jgi:HSP20 family protein